MEETASAKRVIVAAVLSLAVVVGWGYFFGPKGTPPSKTPAVQKEPPATGTSTRMPTQGDHVVAAHATTSTGALPARAQAPVRHIRFDGNVPGADDGGPVPFTLVLSTVGGGVDEIAFPAYYERSESNEKAREPVRLAKPVGEDDGLFAQMASITLAEGSTFKLPARPVFDVVVEEPDHVVFRYTSDEGIEIDREYVLHKDRFEVELAITVRNKSPKSQKHRLALHSAARRDASMKPGSFFFQTAPDHLDALCLRDGKVERGSLESLTEKSQSFPGRVQWIALDRQYFVAALVPRDNDATECQMDAKGEMVRATALAPMVVLEPGEEKRHKYTAYFGAKHPALLARLEADLDKSIDYTVLGLNLAWLCGVLLAVLAAIHGFVGSWGLSIIGLTLLVKAMLFPLNQRSGRSMRAMAELKPKIDHIREKHAQDRQRQHEEMMKLYRTNGVNPASGCLPILLQTPIWLALYKALWVSMDLYQEPFMWLPDLTRQDPFYVLPVVFAAVLFLQQKTMPTPTMDPAQQKMMLYFMPAFSGFILATLPSGLVFYNVVNSVLTIVQQHFINRSIKPKAPAIETGQKTQETGGSMTSKARQR